MRDLDELFTALAGSSFRQRFELDNRDRDYLARKPREVIRRHARDFIVQRLSGENPVNDGRQTPLRGHPVFTAQHATGTCCRKCLSKWHRIPRGRPLQDSEIEYVLRVIDRWLSARGDRPEQPESQRLPLFEKQR